MVTPLSSKPAAKSDDAGTLLRDKPIHEARAKAARREEALGNLFNGGSDAQKADAREIESSNKIGQSLTWGIGSKGIGYGDNRRPAVKSDAKAALPAVVQALAVNSDAKHLVVALRTRTAELPFGEIISFGTSDVADMLGISQPAATTAIGQLQRIGAIIAKSDGALGVQVGWVLDRDLRA